MEKKQQDSCVGLSTTPRNTVVYARMGQRDYCMLREIMRVRGVNLSDAIRESVRLYYSILRQESLPDMRGQGITIILQNPNIDIHGEGECRDIDLTSVIDNINKASSTLERVYIDLNRIAKRERDKSKATEIMIAMRKILEAKKLIDESI